MIERLLNTVEPKFIPLYLLVIISIGCITWEFIKLVISIFKKDK
jgi:hypothetical protein